MKDSSEDCEEICVSLEEDDRPIDKEGLIATPQETRPDKAKTHRHRCAFINTHYIGTSHRGINTYTAPPLTVHVHGKAFLFPRSSNKITLEIEAKNMKKLVLSTAAMLLGLGAIGVSHHAAPAFAEGEGDALADLLIEYATEKSNQYTKKSTIFIDQSVEGFDLDFYHAGVGAQQRTTYYTEDALLMGDLNGGFSEIHSGYANSEGGMQHFYPTGDAGLSALTDSSLRTVDYTVSGATLYGTTDGYFYDLNRLAGLVDGSTGWTYAASTYTYTISTLEYDEKGDYLDETLKGFQYFAAPMLLMHKRGDSSHYLSPSSITVNESNGVLSIKLYAASDTGKLYSEGGLLAEARVYKGLVLPGYFVIGAFSNWEFDNDNRMGNGDDGNYAKAEPFAIPSAGDIKIVQLGDDGYLNTWYGPHGKTDSNNYWIGHDGLYNLYLSKGSETDGYIYANFVQPLTFEVYTESSGIYVYLYNADDDSIKNADWPGVLLTDFSKHDNNYVIDAVGYTNVIFHINQMSTTEDNIALTSITTGVSIHANEYGVWTDSIWS